MRRAITLARDELLLAIAAGMVAPSVAFDVAVALRLPTGWLYTMPVLLMLVGPPLGAWWWGRARAAMAEVRPSAAPSPPRP